MAQLLKPKWMHFFSEEQMWVSLSLVYLFLSSFTCFLLSSPFLSYCTFFSLPLLLYFLFLYTNVWCCVSGRKVVTWYKWRAGSERLTSLFPSSAIGIHISFISFLSNCLTVVSCSRKTISLLLSFFWSVTGNGFFFHYLRIHSLGSSFSCRSNQSLFNHSFTDSFLSKEFRSVFLVSSAPQFFLAFIKCEKEEETVSFSYLSFFSVQVHLYKVTNHNQLLIQLLFWANTFPHLILIPREILFFIILLFSILILCVECLRVF